MNGFSNKRKLTKKVKVRIYVHVKTLEMGRGEGESSKSPDLSYSRRLFQESTPAKTPDITPTGSDLCHWAVR